MFWTKYPAIPLTYPVTSTVSICFLFSSDCSFKNAIFESLQPISMRLKQQKPSRHGDLNIVQIFFCPCSSITLSRCRLRQAKGLSRARGLWKNILRVPAAPLDVHVGGGGEEESHVVIMAHLTAGTGRPLLRLCPRLKSQNPPIIKIHQ